MGRAGDLVPPDLSIHISGFFPWLQKVLIVFVDILGWIGAVTGALVAFHRSSASCEPARQLVSRHSPGGY
jgi:hypothetical protein